MSRANLPRSSTFRIRQGVSIMEWVAPQHEEINLNCEVSSYANAELQSFWPQEAVSGKRARMRVRVLGCAAGGGFPQWNCGCPNCSGLRNGSIKARPRTQAQVAVSPDPSRWFLLNASPDLRQQILATPELSVISSSLGPPISTILLTSADVDSVLGLLHLREFQPLRIYSTLSVRRALTEENSLFRILSRSNPPVQWETLS